MRRKFFSAVFFLGCLLTFTNNIQAQTAIQFSDKMTAIADSLNARGKKWGAAFNDVYAEKNFASLIPMRIELENFIDARIKELEKMKDVKNSKDYREAMIAFLVFEKTMVTTAIKPMEQLTKDTPEEEIKAKIDKLVALSAKEDEELKKVGEKQEAYAKANGFRIKNEE